MNNTELNSVRAEGEFTIARTFNAPRDLVFAAWTKPEHLARWWGPKGFGINVESLDLRPGGTFHYSMDTPSGERWWGKFVYREISPVDRLVFVSSFADEKANAVRAPFAPGFPLEILSTVTLTEQNGKTTLTMRGVPLNATDAELAAFKGMHSSMTAGWTGTLDQLAGFLANALEPAGKESLS